MSLQDIEEELPAKKKKKGKTFFTRKRIALILVIVIIFALGAAFQHYYLEPLYGETIAEKYTRCLTQNNVLDERYVSCSNQLRACEYDLSQCQAT